MWDGTPHTAPSPLFPSSTSRPTSPNEFIHHLPSFCHFHVNLPPLYMIILFSLLLSPLVLFSELSHTSLSHSFCHGQGKENDRPTSRKSKRGTTVQGELCPDVELKAARSRSPPDGLSKAENSERRREKKEPC